jgi:hypothetical protein
VERAETIVREGFENLCEEFGWTGVCFATTPLGANDGFQVDVTLCLDIPDEIFEQYECTDELQAASGYRLALIPAAVLNRHGPVQIYDHEYAGLSRREMLIAIRSWEEVSADHPKAREMRRALQFFDRIGWLTPLKPKEQSES